VKSENVVIVLVVVAGAAVVPTIIELLPESGRTKVAEDATLELICRASGKPDPVITWTHRQHQSPVDVITQFCAFKLRLWFRCKLSNRSAFTKSWTFSWHSRSHLSFLR